MVAVSSDFLDIVKSNIRPQIVPKIELSGYDENNKPISLTWTSQNITELSYKRGIDPTGQTLPYMELTWKEFYFGKLNSENYPEKYDNVVKYMAVKLKFIQKMDNNKTWGDLNLRLWGDLKNSTWKENAKNEKNETVEMPTMFLVARPVVEGHTITWTARDLMYFLNENVSHCFTTGIPWTNPIRWLLLNEISNFTKNFSIVSGLSLSQANARDTALIDQREISQLVIFEGSTKDLLKNSAMTQACYFDFENNYLVLKRFIVLVRSSLKVPVFTFTKKIMREYPKLTKNTDISSFSINRYVVNFKEDEAYTLEPTETLTYTDYKGQNLKIGRYIYKDYGVSSAQSSLNDYISKEAYNKFDDEGDNVITVTPIEHNSVTEFYENSIDRFDDDSATLKSGEPYVEDNPLNYCDIYEGGMVQKLASLNAWYSSSKYSIEVNSLSNVALETGDLVKVETNLYDNSGNFLTKRAVVVGIELTYNGTLHQKTYLHEVK